MYSPAAHGMPVTFAGSWSWRLASGWYAGRLDTPYQRREPKEAHEYFASVGLGGPFWGNAPD